MKRVSEPPVLIGRSDGGECGDCFSGTLKRRGTCSTPARSAGGRNKAAGKPALHISSSRKFLSASQSASRDRQRTLLWGDCAPLRTVTAALNLFLCYYIHIPAGLQTPSSHLNALHLTSTLSLLAFCRVSIWHNFRTWCWRPTFIQSHLVVRVLYVPIRHPLLESFQHIPPRVRDAEHWKIRFALFQTRSPQQDVAHEAQAAVGGQGVVVPAHGAAVAAAERLAVPQEPVEPQTELQVFDALCPVLRSVLLQCVSVRGVQRHDVLLRETFKAVRLILSVNRGHNREEKGHTQAAQEHRHLHRLRQETGRVLNGSGNFLLLHQGMLMSACT